MAKLPSMQFYPGDWRKDPGVQSLDYETRGIWFEILLLMFESSERGYLLLNGKPMPEDALCRFLGLDKQKTTTTLTNLLNYGVISKDNRGAFFSRRMVRDEEIRAIRSKAGSLGGNPNLVKQNPTPSARKMKNEDEVPIEAERKQTGIPTSFQKFWTLAIEIFGPPSTYPAEQALRKGVEELVRMNATENALRKRCEHYRKVWPNAAFTLHAVLKNWDTLKTVPYPKPVQKDAVLG